MKIKKLISIILMAATVMSVAFNMTVSAQEENVESSSEDTEIVEIKIDSDHSRISIFDRLTETTTAEEETKAHTTGNEELDAICKTITDLIITDDMTDREKLYACYRWIEDNFTYVHMRDYETWQEGAIDTFNNYCCDCYGFYASLRALFEYLGFECKETTSIPKDHYWLRVKFEGRWLHCDVTNTWGPEERFLYTNDQLLSFYYEKPGYGGLWYEWNPEPEVDPEPETTSDTVEVG